MKKLMIALLICFGIQAFANDTSFFRDEDTGFLMVIPEGMHESFSFNLYDYNLKLNAFVSTSECIHADSHTSSELDFCSMEEESEESFANFVVVGTMPSCCALDKDHYKCILSVMEENFPLGDQNFYWMGDNLIPLNDAADERLQILMAPEEDEPAVACDIHFFNRDNHLTFVITGVISEEGESDEFSQEVMKNICFID